MEKIKSLIRYIKQNGLKFTISAVINKIRYGKAVLDEYSAWISSNEPNKKDLEKQKTYISCQDLSFTLICERKSEDLEKSIKNQTYSKYEVFYLEEKMLEEIIEEAKGDYIVFLGKNIKLAPFALYEFVQSIEFRDSILIYSDNDKIIDGKRTKPNFKPGFGKDTIISKNYIGQMIVVKTKFLKVNKEILLNLNKNMIYDLVFNISERTRKIEHIEKILYHELKEVMDINTKDEKEIISKHLKRSGLEYETIEDGMQEGQYKVNYKIKGNPLISLVIPNKDHIDDLEKLLASLEKSTYQNYEIIIVENNSENPETFDFYKKIAKENSKIKIVNLAIEYFNYSAIVNFGVENSNGEYVVLLNNDIEFITPNWMEEMLMYAQRSDVGICGMKLFFPDRSIQHAGVAIGIRGLAGHKYREVDEKDFGLYDYINIVQDLSAVTAACFMIKKQLYIDLLGFDEKLAVAFNDIDFCLKVRENKYLIVYNPFSEAYHYESKSRGLDTSAEKQKRFLQEWNFIKNKWTSYIESDPFYNDNFSKDNEYKLIGMENN